MSGCRAIRLGAYHFIGGAADQALENNLTPGRICRLAVPRNYATDRQRAQQRPGGPKVSRQATAEFRRGQRFADGLFPVQGDRIQLQRVLLDLILNEVEAMGSVEAGVRELLISTEQDHTGVLVAVRDSGPGIDPTHLERVFKPFYTTKSSGVGMGLSICRSIIDAHGGRLWAEANEPRGAVLQFSLPGSERELTNPLQSPQGT